MGRWTVSGPGSGRPSSSGWPGRRAVTTGWQIHGSRVSGGSPTTARSAGCTATRRCSSAGSGPLLLQSLHPLAMAAVARHSGYRATRGDDCSGPVTSSPSRRSAGPRTRRQPSRRVRAVHARVTGSGGRRAALRGRRPAPADLGAHRGGGQLPARAHPLRRPAAGSAGRDGYVADMARIGASSACRTHRCTEAELADRIGRYRAELTATLEARAAARFLLISPPLPAVARAPYGRLLAAASGVAAARLGPPPAPAAPPAGHRDRAGPPRRRRPGSRHPLGDHRAAGDPGQLSTGRPGAGRGELGGRGGPGGGKFVIL